MTDQHKITELENKVQALQEKNDNLKAQLKAQAGQVADLREGVAGSDSLPAEVKADYNERRAAGLSKDIAMERALAQHRHNKNLSTQGDKQDDAANNPAIRNVTATSDTDPANKFTTIEAQRHLTEAELEEKLGHSPTKAELKAEHDRSIHSAKDFTAIQSKRRLTALELADKLGHSPTADELKAEREREI